MRANFPTPPSLGPAVGLNGPSSVYYPASFTPSIMSPDTSRWHIISLVTGLDPTPISPSFRQGKGWLSVWSWYKEPQAHRGFPHGLSTPGRLGFRCVAPRAGSRVGITPFIGRPVSSFFDHARGDAHNSNPGGERSYPAGEWACTLLMSEN